MPVREPRSRKRWPAGSSPVCVDALRSLVPAVRNGQRVAGAVRRAAPGAWAGELADGAAPLQLQPGQIALPPGAGEDGCVDAAEREVDERRPGGVITPLPFFDGFVREREGENAAERSCQARARVGERLQDRSRFPQYLDQVLFGLVERDADQGAEFAELIGRVDKVVPLLVEFRQRIGDGLKRPIHDGLLLGQLSDQAVQALGGRDDISALVVEIRGESVQLLYEAAQILLAAPKRGTERRGDVL